MIKPGAADVSSVALGIFAGIIVWAVTGVVLRAVGWQSYALTTALPVALVVAAVVAPVLLRWTRKRTPQHFRQCLGILFGTLGFLLYASIAVVLLVPEAIMFLG